MTARSARSNAQIAAVEDSDDEDQDSTETENLNTATVTLEWNDFKFDIPKRRGRWPVRAVRELNRGNNLEALVALLGGESEWPRLEEACPTRDDLDDFSDHVASVINRECVP